MTPNVEFISYLARGEIANFINDAKKEAEVKDFVYVKFLSALQVSRSMYLSKWNSPNMGILSIADKTS